MCQNNEEKIPYEKHVRMCARENLARYGHLLLGGSYYTYTGNLKREVASYAEKHGLDRNKLFEDVKVKIEIDNLRTTTGIMYRDLPNWDLCDPLKTDDEEEKLKLEKIRKKFAKERVLYMCRAQDCVVGKNHMIFASYEKCKELARDCAKRHNLNADRFFSLVYKMASYERWCLRQETPEQH